MLCGSWSGSRVYLSPIKKTLKSNQQQKVIIHGYSIRRSNCSASSTSISMDAAAQQQSTTSFDFLTNKPYDPPSWASHLRPIPSHFFSLGHVIINYYYYYYSSLSLSLYIYIYIYIDEILFVSKF